jgi:glutamate racemase
MKKNSPIGIFDSGVGGLSVVKEIHASSPNLPISYFADQIHVPYGSRNMEEIRLFSAGITRFLITKGARIVVVACNTASAAALKDLRIQFPEVSFVGMEPAIKPAAEYTKSGIVGVLATPATFQGLLYASVVQRFGQGVTLLQSTCPGLVQQIERGDLNSKTTRQILDEALTPMLIKGIDAVVLGCTHYPFVISLIREIVGPEVRIIDPSPAVAKQTIKVLESLGGTFSDQIRVKNLFYTSGDKTEFKQFLTTIVGISGSVGECKWVDGILQQKLISS